MDAITTPSPPSRITRPPHAHTQMLQVVSHLRRSGYFVGVALTKPFAFEGARKAEQADALVEAMEDVASLVVRACVHVCVCAIV